MERAELIAVVQKLLNADYSSEDERHQLLALIERNVRHPYVSDLIFYPEREMTAEEIVDTALAYEPIHL